MKDFLKKTISLMLLLGLLGSLSGCGRAVVSEEYPTEQSGDPADGEGAGQAIGQELEGTYAADHIFSLNSVSSSSFNPYLTTSAWNKVVSMLVYETLVTQDENFCAQPNLITSWETEDGITWKFTVDTERKFSNGDPMSSLDAVYSLQYAVGYHTLNSTQYLERFRNVEEITWPDTESFTVVLKQANYRFYELMNIPCIEYNHGFDSLPPGTGPYVFSSSGNYLVLNEYNPHAAEMAIDTIHLKEYSAAVDILQAFEDSYLDLVINDPTGMSSLGFSSTNITKYIETTSLHYLGYNVYSGIFGQSTFRSLLTYAIDRASIVSDIMQGAATAATLPIHPNSPLYPEEYAKTLNYTKEGFQNALANAGVADLDGDGFLEFGGLQYTISFIVCSDSAMKVSAARLIAKNLRECGVDVNLRELSYDEYVEALKNNEYDIYYAEVRLCGDWDLSPIIGSGGSLNYGNIGDAALDSYMNAVKGSQGEVQEANLTQLYQYIGQNAPITAICFERSQVLYHRGVISGLTPTQDNIFRDMQNWEINLD